MASAGWQRQGWRSGASKAAARKSPAWPMSPEPGHTSHQPSAAHPPPWWDTVPSAAPAQIHPDPQLQNHQVISPSHTHTHQHLPAQCMGLSTFNSIPCKAPTFSQTPSGDSLSPLGLSHPLLSQPGQAPVATGCQFQPCSGPVSVKQQEQGF